MILYPMKDLLVKAYKNNYAVPAFNVCNLENIQSVLKVANEKRSPVIIQAHFLEVYYAGAKTLVDMVRDVGADMDLEVAVHLDHGESIENVMRSIQGGFTSVMYDGSPLPLEENIANTRKVVEFAHAAGVTVEGEIGTIGQTTEMGEKIENAYLADAGSAERLANETGIDCLAVAIGNAHGFYRESPQLDFNRLEEITEKVSIPLVLHGGTGIPGDQIQQAVKMGIAKINFSTALRSAFINGIKSHLAEKPDDLGLMDIMATGSRAMEGALANSIELCMSGNRL